MRVFKPLDLSLQHSQFAWKDKNHFSVSIIAGFSTVDSEPVLEQDFWQLIPEQLGDGQILDMGMPKPNAEVLVTGKAFSPGNKPVKSLAIGVNIGDLKKELVVYGDRYWGLTGISEPDLFNNMAVDYSHAFGGMDYKKNPLGKGMEDVDVFGEMRRPLPNIESAEHVMTAKGQTPLPAGFGPLDIMWEQRSSRVGTYDDKWIKERAPGYADDLDWTYFNTAPKDQWLDGFFNGDEKFSIVNMHPEKQRLEGKLPGYRARCFVNQRKENLEEKNGLDFEQSDMTFKEIEMNAETVWFFPEVETGVIIYRGTIQIQTDDASDIEHMIIGYENMLDPARDKHHYEDAILKRLDPDTGYLYLMDTAELIPDGARCGFIRMLEAAGDTTESSFSKNMDAKVESIKQEVEEKVEEQRVKLREQLTQANVDPEPYIEKLKLNIDSVPDDSDMKELKAIVDKIMPGVIGGDEKDLDFKKLDMSRMEEFNKKISEIAENKKQQAKQEILNVIQDLENKANDNKKISDSLVVEITKLKMNLENMNKKPELPRPPSDNINNQVREQISDIEEQIKQIRDMGIANDDLPSVDIDIDDVEKNLQEMSESVKESYRKGAHVIEGRPPHKEPLDIILHRFKKSLDKKESVAEGDYAGIDLSGMDLSNINLSGCYLEYANLSGAILHNTNFNNAILAHANLSNAKLQGANLQGANIGDADLSDADFTGANLQDATISKSKLIRTKLIQCNLQGISEVLEADLTEVDLSESVLSSISFLETPMDMAKFNKTIMPNTNFIKCSLNGANFSNAVIDESNWIGVSADNAVFDGASMFNNRFPDNSSLSNASFIKSNINNSNFRETNLLGADFTESSFEMADFGEANLQKSSFFRAIGKRSQFIKSDLANANMSSMNMMEGTLMKARLTGADFSYSNLYAVEFMGATVGETDFSHANLDMSKLQDWRPSR